MLVKRTEIGNIIQKISWGRYRISIGTRSHLCISLVDFWSRLHHTHPGSSNMTSALKIYSLLSMLPFYWSHQVWRSRNFCSLCIHTCQAEISLANWYWIDMDGSPVQGPSCQFFFWWDVTNAPKYIHSAIFLWSQLRKSQNVVNFSALWMFWQLSNLDR
jgi:hypothetical protein